MLFWVIASLLVGACIGSFLSVVVSRLPQMLLAEWKRDCAELNDQTLETTATFNLAVPRSHCPRCKKTLHLHHNLPIIGFLILRGKCGFCQHKFSIQYLLIEILAAVLTLFTVLYWGIGLQLIAPLITGYCFIALAFIDYNEQLLPDCITLSLLWLGLLYSLTHQASVAIIGAVGGYCVPWLINRLFMLIRKKPGMGHGDFKCLAAIGAWTGLIGALGSYILAAVISLFVAIPLFICKKAKLGSALPFGPFLCLTGWLWVNFGPQLKEFLNQLLIP